MNGNDNITLMNLLRNAILYGDSQELINIYAKALAGNIAADKETYEKLLVEYGYKDLPEKSKGGLK